MGRPKGSKNKAKDEPVTEATTAAAEQVAGPVNPAPDKFEVATDTLRGDIRDVMIDEFKSRGKLWSKMTEYEQESVISRLDHVARGLVDQAVNLIAHQGAPHLVGDVAKFTVKNGIKLEFGVAALTENLVKLANHRGAAVLVLIEPHKYQGHRKPAETDVVGDLAMPKERADEALLGQVGRGNGEAPAPAVDPVPAEPPTAEMAPVDVSNPPFIPPATDGHFHGLDNGLDEAPAMP